MDIKQECRRIFLNNQRKVKNLQYTVPSPDTYPYQWLWDSCFHAIILTHFSVDDAKKEILSLLSKQFENGLIPHIIFWGGKKNSVGINWGKKDTSSITQPPMIAYAVMKILQADGDLSFVREVYPKLYHFYRYLLTERDPHEKHLIGIMNPDESGEDNSPRFDTLLNLEPNHDFQTNFRRRIQLVDNNVRCNFDAPFCMRNFFWVKDVPFNCIMVKNLQVLSSLAEKLELSEDEEYFRKKAREISSAMKKMMTADKLYWSLYGTKYRKIKIKTWAIFAPLFAKILDYQEAKELVDKHLLNKTSFWTKYPVPTTSLQEPAFDSRDIPGGLNWRGPVWIGTNWFIYKGLMNYGFNDLAKQIKESSIALIEKSGFREYFDPTTGEGFGAKDFTWGGLIIDMIEI